jgi:hypothetical protein
MADLTLKTITKGMEDRPEEIQANFQALVAAINAQAATLSSLSGAVTTGTKTLGYNDMIKTGVFIVTDGAPGGTSLTDTYGTLYVFARSATSSTQVFIGAMSNKLILRNCNGGTWTSWTEK